MPEKNPSRKKSLPSLKSSGKYKRLEDESQQPSGSSRNPLLRMRKSLSNLVSRKEPDLPPPLPPPVPVPKGKSMRQIIEDMKVEKAAQEAKDANSLRQRVNKLRQELNSKESPYELRGRGQERTEGSASTSRQGAGQGRTRQPSASPAGRADPRENPFRDPSPTPSGRLSRSPSPRPTTKGKERSVE